MKDFCVQITKENKAIVENWWFNIMKYPTGFSWTTGAYYGTKNNERWANGNSKNGPPVITFEEFERTILNKEPQVINDYSIF